MYPPPQLRLCACRKYSGTEAECVEVVLTRIRLINVCSVILDVYNFSNNTITVVQDILSNWVDNPKLVKNFLLLRRYNDEQNVILTFNKPLGETSYGFLIPQTINPAVLSNINTLQANVQAQLLSTQAAVSNTQQTI
jgi:hypothetical protein